MKKAKKKKTAKQKPKSKPAPKKASKKKTSAEPEEVMDRKALKVIAAQLKEMGADLKVLKSDTDELLQKKVNEALQALPPPDVVKKLETISPEKLVTILKKDCLGVFIDLKDVSCVKCKDNEECAQKFIQNVRGGMPGLEKALPDKEPDKKPEKKGKLVPVTKYNPDRLMFVRDVKNPNPKGDDYHDTIQAILDKQPETLGEMRAIVEEDFEIENDAEFMTFVTGFRDPKEGIIKLDVDLSDKDKAALREAGYEV